MKQILCTTYNIISSWFKNWGNDLVVLGYATMKSDDEVYISNNQLVGIINLDETCISLDSGSGQRGSHPKIILEKFQKLTSSWRQIGFDMN